MSVFEESCAEALRHFAGTEDADFHEDLRSGIGDETADAPPGVVAPDPGRGKGAMRFHCVAAGKSDPLPEAPDLPPRVTDDLGRVCGEGTGEELIGGELPEPRGDRVGPDD